MLTKIKNFSFSQFISRTRFPTLIVFLGIATFSVALLGYAYLGIFSRYYADDYCVSRMIYSMGFWKSQVVLYNVWSNRYAGMFMLNMTEVFGRSAIQALPVIIVVSLVISTSWAAWQIVRSIRLPLSKWEVFLLAESIIFFTILESPDRYQTLYWRSAAFYYTVPLVFHALLIGLVVNRMNAAPLSRVARWGSMILCGLLCFFTGGFSETNLLIQLGFVGLSMVAMLVLIKKPDRQVGLSMLWSALIGSLLALLMVLVSPGNDVRQALLPPPGSLLQAGFESMMNGFLFIHITLSDHIIPVLISLLLPLLMVYALSVRAVKWPGYRSTTLIQMFFIIPAIFYLFSVCAVAPTTYFQSSYPEGRALGGLQFLLCITVAVEGVLLGLIFASLHRSSREVPPIYFQVLTALVLVVLCLYPLYDTRKSVESIPEFQSRAALWDARDAQIRSEQNQGVSDIRVQAFDSVDKIMEIGTDPMGWVNQCAAGFYQVKSIVAAP
jgi:hypothetical protein